MTRLFLPAARGCEAMLARECAAILGRGAGVRADRSGVTVDADAIDAMRLNLESRIAQRVLWPLVEGPYRSEDDLYDLARSVDWRRWITPDETLRVDTSAQRSPLASLNFASLRIKDAVCDQWREATGARPGVDTRDPHLAIQLHLTADRAALYVDTSGDPLFKRGWRDARLAGAGPSTRLRTGLADARDDQEQPGGERVDAQVAEEDRVRARGAERARRGDGVGRVHGEAPLKETLAAAMLAAAGWQGSGTLLDPCCGAASPSSAWRRGASTWRRGAT